MQDREIKFSHFDKEKTENIIPKCREMIRVLVSEIKNIKNLSATDLKKLDELKIWAQDLMYHEGKLEGKGDIEKTNIKNLIPAKWQLSDEEKYRIEHWLSTKDEDQFYWG